MSVKKIRGLVFLSIAHLVIGLSGVVLSASGHASDNKGNWISTSYQDECSIRLWNASPVEGETITWEGECKDGKAHGRGTAQWFLNGNSTDKQVGMASNGKLHGLVINYLTNGLRIEGEYYQGRKVGLTKEFYSKANFDQINATAANKNWVNYGRWENDEYVLRLIYSRFDVPRICYKEQHEKDQCAALISEFKTKEDASMLRLNSLASCMSQSEMLAELYDESVKPNKKQAKYYINFYQKLMRIAQKENLEEHVDAASSDESDLIMEKLEHAVGAQIQALSKQNLSRTEMKKKQEKLFLDALLPAYNQHCLPLVK